MSHEIETQWMGKMQFNALINGHTVIMDAPEKVGGEDNGPAPKPFVLTALSGCTGSIVNARSKSILRDWASFMVSKCLRNNIGRLSLVPSLLGRQR